jgi:predicted 3-demethylubiquinone-9 3-methyltransferase (glyoxalase superfamily)
MQNKIIPSLWFAKTGGDVTKIVAYYQGIFGAGFEAGQVMDMGDTPSGKTQLCQVKIFGQRYNLMSTQKEQADFNDAFALTIECDNQEEIDVYWNYFTKEGSEVMCGWCIDKYGFRWQVIPKNLGELLARPGCYQVMMGQKKIVIADYLK